MHHNAQCVIGLFFSAKVLADEEDNTLFPLVSMVLAHARRHPIGILAAHQLSELAAVAAIAELDMVGLGGRLRTMRNKRHGNDVSLQCLSRDKGRGARDTPATDPR